MESDQLNSYPLTETRNGNYASPGLNLDGSHKYRLKIKTADGKQYASDFEPVLTTPAIDSVGYVVQTDGVQLYANTHDDSNNIKYYRWDYLETWKFHSAYYSQWVSNGNAIVLRTPAQNIYYCFATDTSHNIYLGATTKLSKSVIYDMPLARVPSTSEKLEVKYSILVRQYALSSPAYEFWTNLKKNTEELGSIFDAQPTSSIGNIHNTSDATEPVIGYISVSTMQQKRIFIDRIDLPPTWTAQYPYYCGELDSVKYCGSNGISSCYNSVATELIPKGSTEIPVSAIGEPNITGFLSADVHCVDCNVRGVAKPPAFWK
ncbi:MAG: DUF4249 domain-containing protein [Mucilaginibacter sp.]